MKILKPHLKLAAQKVMTLLQESTSNPEVKFELPPEFEAAISEIVAEIVENKLSEERADLVRAALSAMDEKEEQEDKTEELKSSDTPKTTGSNAQTQENDMSIKEKKSKYNSKHEAQETVEEEYAEQQEESEVETEESENESEESEVETEESEDESEGSDEEKTPEQLAYEAGFADGLVECGFEPELDEDGKPIPAAETEEEEEDSESPVSENPQNGMPETPAIDQLWARTRTKPGDVLAESKLAKRAREMHAKRKLIAEAKACSGYGGMVSEETENDSVSSAKIVAALNKIVKSVNPKFSFGGNADSTTVGISDDDATLALNTESNKFSGFVDGYGEVTQTPENADQFRAAAKQVEAYIAKEKLKFDSQHDNDLVIMKNGKTISEAKNSTAKTLREQVDAFALRAELAEKQTIIAEQQKRNASMRTVLCDVTRQLIVEQHVADLPQSKREAAREKVKSIPFTSVKEFREKVSASLLAESKKTPNRAVVSEQVVPANNTQVISESISNGLAPAPEAADLMSVFSPEPYKI